MTEKEMFEMRLNGASYQEIADACGLSKQCVNAKMRNYCEKKFLGRRVRGRSTNIEKIIYQGIYDYFDEKVDETFTSFAKKIYGSGTAYYITKISRLICGENETWLTIAQIKKICDVCGKPFEEVFKERENKVDENA